MDIQADLSLLKPHGMPDTYRIYIAKLSDQSRLASSSWISPPELRKMVRRGPLLVARACQPPAATRSRSPTCVWQDEVASPMLGFANKAGVLGGANRNATLAVQRVESNSNARCMAEEAGGAPTPRRA